MQNKISKQRWQRFGVLKFRQLLEKRMAKKSTSTNIPTIGNKRSLKESSDNKTLISSSIEPPQSKRVKLKNSKVCVFIIYISMRIIRGINMVWPDTFKTTL